MNMYEVIFTDFHAIIVFANSREDVLAKYPTALCINKIVIH